MSDRSVAEAATNTTHNKNNKTTTMPTEGFESTIPATKWLQTYAFHRTAIGIGRLADIMKHFIRSATWRADNLRFPHGFILPFQADIEIVRDVSPHIFALIVNISHYVISEDGRVT